MQYNSAADTRSFYIHWPFCPYKCHFCPFVAYAGHERFMERYHQALCAEIQRFGEMTGRKLALDTVYLGGGTPSTYPDRLLLDMAGILRTVGDLDDRAEVTIEVNPGTIRPEQVAVWQSAGINRISMGVQSLNDAVLKKLNRHQTVSDVKNALRLLCGAFPVVSIDLILGLPEISHEEWKSIINEIVTWPIQHLSVYFLEVHEFTMLHLYVKENKIALPCDEGVVDLYYWTIATLAVHGFEQYEVSSFARDGLRARHNSMYWTRKPYKAFGAGACSFDGAVRLQNEKNLMKYMEGIERGESITLFSECLTREQVHREQVMLGLRQVRGVPLHEVFGGLSSEEQTRIKEQLEVLKQNNYIVEENDHIKLTPIGLTVENKIAATVSL